jgi:ABC-type Zn uptake system ZnuABC Zn-binding protein ZnuA
MNMRSISIRLFRLVSVLLLTLIATGTATARVSEKDSREHGGTTFMSSTIRLNRRYALSGVGAIMLAPRAARAQATPDSSDSLPVILASTPIFADITARIAGDAAIVRSVIPDGGDPHTYEATPADIVAVEEAVAFIEMGAHLEPFVESGAWRRAVDAAGIVHLVLADHLPLIERDIVIDHGDHTHDLRDGDPHVWLDPAMVLRIVDVLEPVLRVIAPASADTISGNAAAYRAVLETLDRDLVNGLAVIPGERRKLVVFHDAFTYFAERFDFTIAGVILPSPDGEPSAGDLADLIETIERESVPAIFTEPQYDPALVEIVAEEAGVEVGVILTDTFAGLVDSYEGLMRFNLASLVEHLR